MKSYRYEENPLITPADVTPYHDGYEVIGAFNAGIAKYKDEILMLLRVAERPISEDPKIVKAPIYNPETKAVDLVKLRTDDERYDFSDPRVVRDVTLRSGFAYLTSISYIRIARSKEGRRFTIDNKPFIYPSDRLETFRIEDPRVTQIGDTYYIYFTAVLLDLNDPTKVIARSDNPILEPEAEYEKNGFFGHVVFSCGAFVEGDVVKMYYGVADTSMACAELGLQDILDSLIDNY
jgi:predicted GH43/DUF377 family glycosyl hydrolase